MKIYALIAAILALLLTPTIAHAQSQVGEGGVVVFIVTISLIPPEGEVESIGLRGDEDYLNVIWNASYNPPSDDPIGSECYLNCPFSSGDIETACAGYQNCSYSGFQGLASCTINNPSYAYNFSQNNVTCKFFDPNNEDISFVPHPNRTFKPIDFRPFASGLTSTVGEKNPWKISIANLGILNDSYSINITYNPTALEISPSNLTAGVVSYTQVASVFPQMLVVSSQPSTVQVFVSSDKDGTVCSSDSVCSLLGPGAKCDVARSKCGINLQLSIKSGFSSLPDFDTLGLAVIIILSSLIALVFIRTGKT